jgi:competence protein ComFC
MWLVDLIWPKTCEICGAVGKMICGRCLVNLSGAESKCPGCYRYSLGGYTHDKCKGKTSLVGLKSSFLYKDSNVTKLIWALKYEERWGVVCDLLTDIEKPNIIFDLIAYIPMYKTKSRERGYNQARIIALVLGEKWKVKVLEGLQKTKSTKSLATTHDAVERKEVLKGAFVYKGESLMGKRILLVDDVFTSGATMNEVAKILHESGAIEVWGWSIAS